MSLYGRHASGSSSSAQHQPPRATEFDILKASHRFLHDDPDETRNLTWDEQLARKYYSSLFREFAVCDLKHYKTGNVSHSYITPVRLTDCMSVYLRSVRTSLEDRSRGFIRSWGKDVR